MFSNLKINLKNYKDYALSAGIYFWTEFVSSEKKDNFTEYF